MKNSETSVYDSSVKRLHIVYILSTAKVASFSVYQRCTAVNTLIISQRTKYFYLKYKIHSVILNNTLDINPYKWLYHVKTLFIFYFKITIFLSVCSNISGRGRRQRVIMYCRGYRFDISTIQHGNNCKIRASLGLLCRQVKLCMVPSMITAAKFLFHHVPQTFSNSVIISICRNNPPII